MLPTRQGLPWARGPPAFFPATESPMNDHRPRKAQLKRGGGQPAAPLGHEPFCRPHMMAPRSRRKALVPRPPPASPTSPWTSCAAGQRQRPPCPSDVPPPDVCSRQGRYCRGGCWASVRVSAKDLLSKPLPPNRSVPAQLEDTFLGPCAGVSLFGHAQLCHRPPMF